MPPKVKVTKKDIIEGALALVREQGVEAVNARNLAVALGCSTQPIFSNFTSMEALAEEVIAATYQRYLGFIRTEVESEKYPRYKAFGMAYMRFAKEEKELFKLLFMRDRTGEEGVYTEDFEESVQMIMSANGVSREIAVRMHMELWVFVHGIATMLATSFLALDWEQISVMTSDVYQGIRMQLVGDKA